ncbi:MAG: VPLPA-CTERM sorting domain-containing protein [Gammaproteobacteria bacterium]|nr:VPLPA-CTERM sorting domain-containing protein [Gammaproteobacteria bacterium]
MNTNKVLPIFLLGLVSTSANAALIDGTIEMAGGWTPIDSVSTATTIGVATGIDFSNDLSVVVASSGDFLVLPLFTLASMTDFQFNPLTPSPVTLWSVAGFSFSMDSVTIGLQDASNLVLSGTGTITGAGFDATQGTWEFSGQTASDVTFSWSSSNNTVVPVPAAVWLFGSGLIGLIGVARRKKA